MSKAVPQDIIYWLNSFFSDNGVSDTLSKSEIVQVLSNSNYDKLTVDFGEYAQVHTNNNSTTKSRMIGAIDL